MKRIQAACLIQTIGFFPKTEYPTAFEKDLVRKEYEAYKATMDRRGTKYRILKEETQPNGAILVELKKQNNQQPLGSYFS